MTLPTGTITMNQVNVELGNSGTSLISLNDTEVRELAGSADDGTPTYVGGTSQEDTNSDLTLSGLQSGDLVLFFSASDNTNRRSPGDDWTAIPGLGIQPDNDNNPDSAAFYIFSQGSSVVARFLYQRGVHVMIAFRGVDSSSPFNVNASESWAYVGMPNPPSITTVDDKCMIVAVGLLDDDDIASSVTAPSGYTLAVVEDTDSADCTVMTAYKVKTTAGTEDPGTFGGTGTDRYKAQTIALQGVTTSSGSNEISMDDLRGKSAPPTIYTNNLEVWLDAEDSNSYSGSGNTWYDLQNSYDGTLTNGVGYSSSGYFTFDGSNDYVDVSGTGGINAPMSKNMTLSVWVYVTKTNSWQGVFTKDRQYNKQWGLFISNENRFAFGVDGSNLYTSQISSSTWYNVTLVQAANSSRKIYMNGSLESTKTSSFGTDNTGSQNYLIGGATGVNEYFGGRISHALLYENEALSSTQVAANFDLLKSRYGIS
jgi:hypothetical protein